MIINDATRTAFIHIPKCAGTTVRLALEQHDDHEADLVAGMTPHPVLELTYSPDGGETYIDIHHITLGQLQQFFPEVMAKIRAYSAFALVRDPAGRLVSAVTQRLKQFHAIPVQDLPPQALADALSKAFDELDALFARSPNLPPDYIHFQPQVDFIDLGDERIVQNLYPTHDLAALEADLVEHFGPEEIAFESFSGKRANASKVHRFGWLQDMVTKHGGLAKGIKRSLPEGLKPGLKRALYRDRGDALASTFDKMQVEQFLARHYAKDMALWQSVSAPALQAESAAQ
ncbi:sulfotransferase family 2 domain-containing protein [Aurantiacibacter odishensis]|uniref:sulfotransferase family 2 domain-containing protein n=1 Tax=Aurantiacibacter odishensis TaxID=1155476 RepID=UPI000E721364|nr:sulfotransferase family 2 domain-containing protein [Aurantiacibacter odishensis]